MDPASLELADRALRRRHREGGPRLLAGGGGGGQDPRERLPRGQHRPRQRDEGRPRQDGDQRLGGHRGGEDEALRLHALLPGARPRRALHPARPLLPHLEGGGARGLGALHRARGRDQHRDAASTSSSGRPARSTATGRASRARRSSSSASATRPTSTTTASRPSFEIIEKLREARRRGRLLRPLHPGGAARPRARHPASPRCPARAAEFARHDVLVVSTAHSDFKDAALYAGVKLVVDTRNLMAPLGLGTASPGPDVVRA